MGGDLWPELARLALRRIWSAPRMSAVLLAGAVLAVGLASAAPIFIEAVRDLGLRQALASVEASELDLRFIQSGVTADAESVADVEELIAAEVETAAGELLVGRMGAGRTGGYVLRTDAEEFGADGAAHGTFVWQTDLTEQSELREGSMPLAGAAGGTIEVAIEQAQAERFGLAVGDERWAQPFWLGNQHESRIRIVGIVQPGSDERRWSTEDVSFWPIAARDTELRLWAHREDMLGVLSAQSPTLRLTLLQRWRVDLEGLSASAASEAAAALELMQTRLAQALEGLNQETQLVNALTGFRARFTFAQGTLLMVVLQLVGAVLVYAVVAAAMLAEQRTEDTAWLRSRGARRSDVALLHIVEAAVLTAPAVAFGPLIGLGLVSLLGLVPPFDAALAEAGLGPFLPAALPLEAWYLALGAGALALIAQAVPMYRATRETIVTTRRARGRPPVSWGQRALIDAAIAALGALLIFELQWSGEPIDSPLVGETRLDWLAVATPTVLLFVVGLAVLRLFPTAMRALARLAAPLRWLTLLLGAWYLGRTPTHYARTVLLLTIAGALAVFAASFRSTLDASYEARSLHQAGASVRLLEPVSELVAYEEIETLTGQSTAQVKRLAGAFDGDEESGRLGVAALDAAAVAGQLAERAADWAVDPELLASIAPPASSVDRAEIPELGGYLTLRYKLGATAAPYALGVKVLDANGRYWWYTLEEADVQIEADTEWREATIQLTDRPAVLLAPEGARPVRAGTRWRPGVAERAFAPLTLMSLDIALARRSSSVELRDLTYRFGGETVLLAQFDSGKWEPIPLEVGIEPVDSLQVLESEPGVRFSWTGEAASLRGLRYRSEYSPLPALFSKEAAEQGRLAVGDKVRLRVGPMPMTFIVAGTFDVFPAYDPQRDPPLVLMDRAALFDALYSSATAGTALAVLDELWVSAPLAEWSELLALAEVPLDANEVITIESARADLSADPLIVAAWNGVFVGALAAVAVAAAFGLMVLTAVTAQARRVEFAVCQSVGMSVRQILGLIALEQVAVIVIGLGAGLAVGALGGGVLLDFFALTPDGRDVVPPLRFIVDWPGVGVLFGALVALFTANLLAFLWFLRRIELHGALRLAA